MNTEDDAIARRISRLEVQTRRLRVIAYLVWPIVWTASIILAFAPGRLDEKAMRVLLRWIQDGFFGVVVILLSVLTLGFILKLGSDFRNRRSRFALNPGSKS